MNNSGTISVIGNSYTNKKQIKEPKSFHLQRKQEEKAQALHIKKYVRNQKIMKT